MNPGVHLFIIIGGVPQAMGSAMNAALYKSLVNSWLASLVSFALIVCFFLGAFLVLHKPLPGVQQVLDMLPWWAPLAGVIGAVAVYAGLVLVGNKMNGSGAAHVRVRNVRLCFQSLTSA